MNRKSLLAFLLIAFGLAWTLFILPLAFKNNPEIFTIITLIGFSDAMCSPGIAAILATRFVEKQPLIPTFRLNKLGLYWARFSPG